MFRRFAPVLAFIALIACLPLARAQLPEPVLSTLAGGGMPQDAISALVLRGDATVLSHLAERPMAPASTIKLVTTLVGLDTLGPVFRGRTELRSTGAVVKGVLMGDLVLRGGADADFSGAVLEQMLQSLRNQGIERIAGNLLLDRSLFTPARLDLGAAQRLQHRFQHLAGQIGVGAAAQHQVAAQHAIDHVAAAAQLGAAAKHRAQGFQRDQGGDQLHGRRRLHRPFGQVRQLRRVAAQHQHAERVLRDAAGGQRCRHRLGQLGPGQRQPGGENGSENGGEGEASKHGAP